MHARGAAKTVKPHRLDPAVRPTNVGVHVVVDPARSEDFEGTVTIDLALASPRRMIELHAVDLQVSDAEVTIDGESFPGKISKHPEFETIRVQVPERIPAGEATLSLRFAGSLRTDLRGLYASRSGKRRYAFTQLEATDARRFFPCFDEPIMKARFRMSVTTSEKNTVLSNAPALRTKKLPRGKKRVDFRTTPPLSTYLVALAVGELEGSRTVKLGDTPIRVWHVPGKKKLTGFALECAKETLSRLEQYFDLPYPYEKLDLVAVPDFEAGAMENAGAVFFRETLLLVDPKTVTLAEKKRVAEVVCHELAHMWYGDLVTMAWWDDLWLNEAFATWMAFAIVDDWKPEWKMWLDFQHYRGAALNLDALDNTHPIYVEVKTPDEATENFDLITYEKGASVVRMVENWLGPRAFRTGVRSYIREHAEGNTVASDLWRALSAASKEEVEPVVRTWIEQPGFPVLTLRHARERGKSVLHAKQERFTAGEKPKKKKTKKTGDAARWPIPFVARVGGARRGKTRLERRLLTGARSQIELGAGAPRFIHGNAEASGFYRTHHDVAMLRDLAAGLDALSDVERLSLASDQWALVRSGRAGIESFLDLAAVFGKETEPDLLVALRGAFAVADEQLASHESETIRSAWHTFLIDTFCEHLLELGWKPARGEDDGTRVRRAVAISLLGGIAEWEAVTEVVSDRCAAYLKNRASLEPNLADPVVALAARQGDAKLYEQFVKAEAKAETPQERRRFLFARADFRDKKLLERTRRACLDEIAVQDMPLLLVRLLGNPAAREDTWAFIQRRWPKLQRRFPPALVTRMIDALPELQTPKHRREVAAFFRKHPVPTGKRAVQQALERFDLNAAFRKRSAAAFRTWLEERSGD